jgi:hypothetical protein
MTQCCMGLLLICLAGLASRLRVAVLCVFLVFPLHSTCSPLSLSPAPLPRR